jgi:Ser/Thr protein kinase RdoA (MazF antagonist)
VGAAVRAAVVGWRRVESGGYGRVNAHWRVELGDGTSTFVKQALTDEADEWLRKEQRAYESLSGSFLPELRGSGEASGRTFVALEDLGGADWPPPWSDARIGAVLRALDELHQTSAPSWLPALQDMHDAVVGWGDVAADPEPLLRTGACSQAWLERALPELLDAVRPPVLAGDAVLHFDVRSDNLCFVGERVVLVDWNLACVGNGRFDVAFWLPSLALEGGPDPSDVLPGAGALAVAVAGFFAARAGRPVPPGAPTVREFQLAQLKVALPWAARELGLEPPTLQL